MPKFYHQRVLDNGLQEIVSNATQLRLLRAYSANDSFATVNTNTIGLIAIDSSDLVIGSQGTLGRQVAVAQQYLEDLDASGASPDLHIALVDLDDQRVLAVTDETSNQVIVDGNAALIPAFNLKMNQPA